MDFIAAENFAQNNRQWRCEQPNLNVGSDGLYMNGDAKSNAKYAVSRRVKQTL